MKWVCVLCEYLISVEVTVFLDVTRVVWFVECPGACICRTREAAHFLICWWPSMRLHVVTSQKTVMLMNLQFCIILHCHTKPHCTGFRYWYSSINERCCIAGMCHWIRQEMMHRKSHSMLSWLVWNVLEGCFYIGPELAEEKLIKY